MVLANSLRRASAALMVLLLCTALIHAAGEVGPADIEAFTAELVRTGAHLLDPAELAEADSLNRQLRETRAQAQRGHAAERAEASARWRLGADRLSALLENNSRVVRVSVKDQKLVPPHSRTVILPGDSGTLLLRVDRGEGETRYLTVADDLTANSQQDAVTPVQTATRGTTWALISLTNVPAERTSRPIELSSSDEPLRLIVDLQTPAWGRLRVRILSADDGEPTPAMVRLVWKTMGLERRPANAIDFAPQFDEQGDDDGPRRLRMPTYRNHYYYCVPGPMDMLIPPGDWEIGILRGAEHVGVTDRFAVPPGGLIERTYTPRRWVDMRKLGWFSGDDHVHCRIVSDDDADRLMAWVQAEDINLANVVKMGDINRTWFEQRGWGEAHRVIKGDNILSPGQECPRTHDQLGHTLSMNTRSMIRNADRYYIYEEIADAVRAQGGLWGYAHVCHEKFFVDRDMSINVPKGKCDFVELMQFQGMRTRLYYDFLNTGFKLTASAGSDVPWGGSIGEVRVYAYVGEQPFNADSWFEAVRNGRTFVTNGPMVEFRVDDALPGDEISVSDNRKLRVKARAWGDRERLVPSKLEIIRQGEVVRAAEPAEPLDEELALDFEIEAEHGFWLAARVAGNDGTAAHTTPVYVVREGLRFWKFDDVDVLIQKRLSSLREVEQIVAEATQKVESGHAAAERAELELARQGPMLLDQVAAARRIYKSLEQTAGRERVLRAAAR